MKNLTGRLERLERLLPERSPAKAPYNDEEKAEIAKLLYKIHGGDYSNETGRTSYKYPDGLICFNNGKVFYDRTVEIFGSLTAAQKKHPGIQIIPADAGLAEKLFNAFKGGF